MQNTKEQTKAGANNCTPRKNSDFEQCSTLSNTFEISMIIYINAGLILWRAELIAIEMNVIIMKSSQNQFVGNINMFRQLGLMFRCRLYIDWLVQESRNSSANTLELSLCCTNLSTFSFILMKVGHILLYYMLQTARLVYLIQSHYSMVVGDRRG